jgi:hypothetical protein
VRVLPASSNELHGIPAHMPVGRRWIKHRRSSVRGLAAASLGTRMQCIPGSLNCNATIPAPASWCSRTSATTRQQSPAVQEALYSCMLRPESDSGLPEGIGAPVCLGSWLQRIVDEFQQPVAQTLDARTQQHCALAANMHAPLALTSRTVGSLLRTT